MKNKKLLKRVKKLRVEVSDLRFIIEHEYVRCWDLLALRKEVASTKLFLADLITTINFLKADGKFSKEK